MSESKKPPEEEVADELDDALREYVAAPHDLDDSAVHHLSELLAKPRSTKPPPLEPAPPSPRQPTMPSPGKTLPPGQKRDALLPPGKPTVFVVDDNADILDSLTVTLSDEGYTCFRAENGVQAIAKLLGGTCEPQIPRPDVILLDIWMPIISGIDVANMLLLTPCGDIPVILISAGERPPMRNDFIEKPFVLDELLETLKGRIRRET